MSITWVRIGALICLVAVGLGAFGAHALKAILEARHSRDIWNTAVLYQFLHGLALVALSYHSVNRAVGYLFLAGIILFSGSLYLLSVMGATWVGPITPIGGLCFLAGWLWLVIAPR